MKRQFILLLFFVLTLTLISVNTYGNYAHELNAKTTYIERYNEMSSLDNYFNNLEDTESISTTTLIFELLDDFYPNEVWEEIVSLYGEINDNNVDYALNYYNNELSKHYYNLKTDFSIKTGYYFSESDIQNSSPHFTIELDDLITDVFQLDNEILDLLLYDEVYQLYIMQNVFQSNGGLPLDELGNGGSGGSSCESNKMLSVKNVIEYTDDYTGFGIRIGILETSKYVTYGIVNPSHTAIGSNGNISVFGNRVHWHPYFDQLFTEFNSIDTHANNVAHIAAGYNGIAPSSTIHSSDLRSNNNINTSFPGNLISNVQYYLHVNTYDLGYPENSNGYLNSIHVINTSFGDPYNLSDTMLYEKIYNKFVYTYKIPVIASTGNSSMSKVTTPSSAHNVFSVGGTNNDGDDYYSNTSYLNSFNGVIKPNILAPAIVDLTTSTSCNGDTISGTSYAAPIVTGAVAQLLEKEPMLKAYPSRIYALLTATASNNNFANSGYNYYIGFVGNKSGSGILKVQSLLNNSSNTLNKTFGPNDSPIEFSISNINPNNYYKKLKVSIFWLAKSKNNVQMVNQYKLTINYANGQEIISNISSSNYQLIVENINTNGVLDVKIELVGSFNGTQYDNIGFAWALTE